MNNNVLKAVLFGAASVFAIDASAQHNSPAKKKVVFIDQSNMDLTVKPGEDFYTYASGTWIKNNPVPLKETRWGSFNQLRDFNINAVKTILTESASSKAPAGSIERRIGDFYSAGMDSITIEKLGYTPIKSDLQKVEGLTDVKSVVNHAAEMRTFGAGSPFFNFFVGQDRKYVKNIVPQLGQGGTTLPDRDYYLKNDARSVQIQTAYKSYIAKLFTLTGTPEAEAIKNAETIFNFEKKLADAQMSRVEMRDPYKTYN
ncbi:MAG: M13 family peptidase, partial [Phormidesmis sp. FL-bin-119]|nr:M13 family peptidase [Pedobacter sp.]